MFIKNVLANNISLPIFQHSFNNKTVFGEHINQIRKRRFSSIRNDSKIKTTKKPTENLWVHSLSKIQVCLELI